MAERKRNRPLPVFVLGGEEGSRRHLFLCLGSVEGRLAQRAVGVVRDPDPFVLWLRVVCIINRVRVSARVEEENEQSGKWCGG